MEAEEARFFTEASVEQGFVYNGGIIVRCVETEWVERLIEGIRGETQMGIFVFDVEIGEILKGI